VQVPCLPPVQQRRYGRNKPWVLAAPSQVLTFCIDEKERNLRSVSWDLLNNFLHFAKVKSHLFDVRILLLLILCSSWEVGRKGGEPLKLQISPIGHGVPPTHRKVWRVAPGVGSRVWLIAFCNQPWSEATMQRMLCSRGSTFGYVTCILRSVS